MPITARPYRLLTAALLAAAGALLAGCGNNPYPTAEHREAFVYSYLSDDPKTLDPTEVYNVTDGAVANAIYVSYYQYHYLKRDPFELELALGAAEPVREKVSYVSRSGGKPRRVEGERWTFRIKKGLRFQDDPCFPGGKGREIVGDDFLHSFKRMADPAIPCPVLPFMQDKIEGLDAFRKHQVARAKDGQPVDYGFPVEGLQTDPNDPYVFRILLNRPYPQLRYMMAMYFTTPLAHEATSKYGVGLSRHPVGQGPYMLTEWKPKQRLTLRPNPNYRQDDLYPTEGEREDVEAGLLKDAGARLPLNKGIVLTVLKERLTAWNFFQQGYLDVFAVYPENKAQVVARAGNITPEMDRKGVYLVRAPLLAFNYIAFNMKDPVVGGYDEQHRKLRQAMALAWDAAGEIQLFNAGLGTPAQWLVPPGIYGYDPDYKNPYRQRNLARAKQLLAEAGYPGGISEKTGDRLEIYYDNRHTTAQGRQQVAYTEKQFAQIGVKLISRSWRYEAWDERLEKGQFQLYDYGWLADYPDAENFIFLLYGPNERPGPNTPAYDNAEYNRLFEQMQAMDDGLERTAIMNRMRDIAVEDCPHIYTYHDEELKLANGWVSNEKAHPIALDYFKYRKVDPERRAQLRAEWNRPNYWPLVPIALGLIAATIPAVVTASRRRRQSARRSR
ncbi:MAG: ABC transporter substrate-binding protein [Armatimonadota bacterium]